MRRSFAVVAAVFIAACATAQFDPPQQAALDRALPLQARVLADPRFAAVLRELDSAGEIDWIARLSPAAADETDAYPSSLEWLLARFGRDGGLPAGRIAGTRSNPFAAARAAYDPADGVVRLDRASLAGHPAALAGTLLHERVHSFGVVHRGRGRAANACDVAYLAGDLAEALLRVPDERSSVAEGPVCPALCRALERRGVAPPTACPGT